MPTQNLVSAYPENKNDFFDGTDVTYPKYEYVKYTDM